MKTATYRLVTLQLP